MTTIAFDGKTLASDSRGTDENAMVLTPCQKLYTLDSGAILGTAGDDDIRKLLKLLNRASSPEELPSKRKLAKTETDFKGILVFPKRKCASDEDAGGEVFIIEVAMPEGIEEPLKEWTGYVCEIKDSMCAVGTGAPYAYGAMEHGASAEEAVTIATRRDIYSAGPVQTLKLNA